ncbi:MAG: hypothetical protein WKF34_05640 [Pyrinomonadaceae bacterium]
MRRSVILTFTLAAAAAVTGACGNNPTVPNKPAASPSPVATATATPVASPSVSPTGSPLGVPPRPATSPEVKPTKAIERKPPVRETPKP